MTSKQKAQDLYDHVLPRIREAAEEYYGGNLDRGFRHWAFDTYFVGYDIEGNDIVDHTAIDGSDDFEIDGYFIPETDDESVVHLFQSKRREPGRGMGSKELAAFLLAPKRILNAQEVVSSHNEETKALHDRLIAMLKTSNGGCSINLVWATSGRLTPMARKHAEENRSWIITTEVNGSPTEIPVTLECLDLTDLCRRYDDQLRGSDSTIKCDYTFDLEEGSFHETNVDAKYRTLSMTLPVKQIIDVFVRHSFDIFRLNPRGPLGNKVNSDIKNTLLDETDRKRFHLLNNGITAISSGWAMSENKLHVEDFQIINGCQTTYTLWNVRALVQDDPSVLVTVKLIDCPEDFAPRIATTTNRQTGLRAEDSISNDQNQDRIKQEFASMSPPWFYQTKRGQWQRMTSSQEREKFRVPEGDPVGGFRLLYNKEVCQAIVAFAGFPGEAKDNIRSFMKPDGVVSSLSLEGEISYGSVFAPGVRAVQLLLPALIQRKVWRRVVEDKPTEDWLEYARFHIVWLVGNILRSHYESQDKLFAASRATKIIAQIDDWFGPVYQVAVSAIRNSLAYSKQQGEFSGNREFFRTPSKYRAIESNVQSALSLASSFGDPMANLPA